MHAYVKESIAILRAEVARQGVPPKDQPVKQHTPLRNQIIRLMAEMPPELRSRPWSISELVNQLQGRYRAHPHAQLVARELIALGWRRTRLWTSEGRGSRIWHPPEVLTKEIIEGKS